MPGAPNPRTRAQPGEDAGAFYRRGAPSQGRKPPMDRLLKQQAIAQILRSGTRKGKEYTQEAITSP